MTKVVQVWYKSRTSCDTVSFWAIEPAWVPRIVRCYVQAEKATVVDVRTFFRKQRTNPLMIVNKMMWGMNTRLSLRYSVCLISFKIFLIIQKKIREIWKNNPWRAKLTDGLEINPRSAKHFFCIFSLCSVSVLNLSFLYKTSCTGCDRDWVLWQTELTNIQLQCI